MEQNENTYYETTKISKLLATFAIPSIISLLVNALYNIIDQIFIGRGVGYLGNGATTIVFPITVVATSLTLLFGDGGASYLSLKLGSGDRKEAMKSAGNSTTLLVICGIGIGLISALFLKPLLLFGSTETILPYALNYGRIITIGMPFIVISTGLNSIIRAAGEPKFSMISMLMGAIVNTILDPLFIFVFKWGVQGAALATIIGQIVSFIISIIVFINIKSLNLRKEDMYLSINTIKHIMALGVSSFITQVAL